MDYESDIAIFESDTYEGDYWQGVMVITDKVTGKCGNVSLRDTNGKNVTLSQFKWNRNLNHAKRKYIPPSNQN